MRKRNSWLPQGLRFLHMILVGVLFTLSTSLFANSQSDSIKAVLFDIFGTVVDWRGSMLKEFTPLFEQKNITNVTSEAFINAWVTAYSDNMTNISEGKSPFATVDALNKIALDEALTKYHLLDKFTENEREQMWMIWHRLQPWSDSVPGINKLKTHFIIGPLSNGNVKLLTDLSSHADLNWDIIISGETIGHYKPDPVVYQSAAKILKLNPSEILLVASHKYDLEAARQCGYKTAYIFRPLEFDSVHEDQYPHEHEFDFNSTSIEKLAEILLF